MTTTALIRLDHIERSFGRMLSQYKDKPRIEALIRAIARVGNVCEEELFSVIQSFNLDSANHKRLDVWGDIVGEKRGGLNDDDYRRFIQARMLVSVSSRTTDEIIKILQTITSPSTVHFRPLYPASYMITVYRNEPLTDIVARRVARMMSDARPPAVGFMLVEASAPAFGFDGNTGARGYGVGTFSRTLVMVG